MGRDSNTSNAFAASLSFGFAAEPTDYSLTSEDVAIEKYAGIGIYQPTIDNVESFIRKYVMSELAGGANEGVSSVDISVMPSRFDTLKPDYVRDAQGSVSLKVGQEMLQLPFIVIDEEFLPFDIIQLNKQRVPYSRENLRKIIGGIINQKKNTSPVPEFDPYKRVEKPINPSSSIGFLGDVLKIQEQHAFRTTSGGNMYVTAEAKLDEALEKLASMKPITSDDWKALENTIKEKVVGVEVEGLQKMAEEIREHDDSKMAMIFNKVKEMPFVDANSLPHGTIVAFPELQCKEISMNKGIIIDDYMDIAGIVPRKIKIIVSQDCRMKILDNRDRFLCFKVDPQGFRIHARELDIISKDDLFFAFDGNKALVPCVVRNITERVLRNGGEVGYNDFSPTDQDENRKTTAFGRSGVKVYDLEPIYECTRAMSLFSDDGVDRTKANEDIFRSPGHIKLATLKNAKFNEVPYNEFLKKKACELGITEMLALGLAPHEDVCTSKGSQTKNGGYRFSGNVVLCTDENTKIIRIKGLIKDHMRNKEDLEHMANASHKEFEVILSGDDKSYNKAAFASDTKMEKSAGVEAMTQTTDLGGDRIPDSPMISYWLTGMDQSQKQACEEAKMELDKIAFVIEECVEGIELDDRFFEITEDNEELRKIALSLKAVPNQASRFKVMSGLKNLFEKKLDAHASKLATNDWIKLKQKGFLSPDEKRVMKPFNHMGLELKNKGFADVKSNYKQMLSKEKSIGNSKFTKISSENSNEFFKTAGDNEYIEVRSVDKDRGTYNLKIVHTDKTKKIFKSLNREFKAIPYQEVREVLKAIGYGNIKVSEVMQRAKRDNYAKYELPEGSTPEKLSGGQVAGPVASTMAKIKNTIFDSNIGDAIAAELAGAILAGAVLGGGTGSKPIYDTMKKFATEASNLSSAFEKLAFENKSKSMLKVARVMALSSHFNEKIGQVASGKAQYFKLNDAVSDILSAKPALEKMASELIDLKVDQFNKGTMIVNPGYIQAAVKSIDRMYNIAAVLSQQ